ncbi:CO dehydrogenase flavoprotein C-terminal domain [Acididesulfobacillus acetoxydans]|uniref:Aerobic-type carbon monoxide dehydrogenase, middle subunit CoxM/CutM-like protein n=1 Tax=Acididesulfobacillus acetoxydans TaxID=1561005 RepID=A0A8S0X176_9FIRM|nr:FAD binding domain-containing protein [Acididesulfobacillus acetoxydans]CAA7602981.1 CO dehydrogenase flavoprotein C-terminal domain [Acididesulfobacillus acetoxydans]CEJ05863.1 Aerobic-type carbon monoxide dehydrogenase, middle subunit CoxM/CutM-like protein [Acididesulfobacillus acetoxydans]
MYYIRPQTLAKALEAGEEPGMLYLAGGTDLILKLRRREVQARGLVDLQAVAELRQIRAGGDWLEIGAMVSFADLLNNDTAAQEARALWLACSSMGAPQIRNQATLGGNLANCSPAADSLPALLVLQAQVRLLSRSGEVLLPLAEVLGRTPLWQPGTLLAGFRLPLRAGVSGFAKLGRRQALAIARLSAAVALREENGRACGVRVAFGAAGKRAFLSLDLAEELNGLVLDRGFTELACRQAKKVISRALGERASAPYKKEAVAGVVREALRTMEFVTSGEHADVDRKGGRGNED